MISNTTNIKENKNKGINANIKDYKRLFSGAFI